MQRNRGKTANPVPISRESGTMSHGNNSHQYGRYPTRAFPEQAPNTVKNFTSPRRAARMDPDPSTGQQTPDPLYDGVYRVIDGFMIQGGDPLGTGRHSDTSSMTKSTRLNFDKLPAGHGQRGQAHGQRHRLPVLHHRRPDPWLLGNHTIFGEVIDRRVQARC